MKPALAATIVLAAMPAFAHRLDEYLQGALISVAKNQVQVEMTLAPGVAVVPVLIADIDTNADGAISEAERRAYADRVLRDISLGIDGHSLQPRLISVRFPAMEEMREGRGEIQLNFNADLPPGGRLRKLTFENRHESRIAAYQANSLVPGDPDIRISAQNRNYSQSLYQLEYQQDEVHSSSAGSRLGWLLAAGALVLFMRLLVPRRAGARSVSPAARHTAGQPDWAPDSP